MASSSCPGALAPARRASSDQTELRCLSGGLCPQRPWSLCPQQPEPWTWSQATLSRSGQSVRGSILGPRHRGELWGGSCRALWEALGPVTRALARWALCTWAGAQEAALGNKVIFAPLHAGCLAPAVAFVQGSAPPVWWQQGLCLGRHAVSKALAGTWRLWPVPRARARQQRPQGPTPPPPPSPSPGAAGSFLEGSGEPHCLPGFEGLLPVPYSHFQSHGDSDSRGQVGFPPKRN